MAEQSEQVTEKNLAPLPAVYDSLAQCVGATGIPIAALKRAKQAGCSAFKSNRIYLRPLIDWLFSAAPEASKLVPSWKDVKEEYSAKREKLRHDRDTDALVSRAEAVERIRAGMSTVFSELDRIFCNELPPSLRGCDEVQIRTRCLVEIERLRQTLIEKFTLPKQGGDK